MNQDEILKLIKEQFKAHIFYIGKFEKANSAFSVEYYHPVTKKRMTYSEMVSLIDKDAEKRSKKIIKNILQNNE